MSDWRVDRRSTPAPEVPGIPDSALDWACWTSRDYSESVAIYRDGENYYVTHTDGSDVGIEASEVDRESACRTAEDLRERSTGDSEMELGGDGPTQDPGNEVTSR